MLLVVESQATNCSNIIASQRSKKQFDLRHLVCDLVLAENVTVNDFCPGGFSNVFYSRGKKSIAVVDLAILGQEANKTLKLVSAAHKYRIYTYCKGRHCGWEEGEREGGDVIDVISRGVGKGDRGKRTSLSPSSQMARLSGLQRDVLSLYRKCLREIRKKPAVSLSIPISVSHLIVLQESRPNFKTHAR
jgi:hypothetical protein